MTMCGCTWYWSLCDTAHLGCKGLAGKCSSEGSCSQQICAGLCLYSNIIEWNAEFHLSQWCLNLKMGQIMMDLVFRTNQGITKFHTVQGGKSCRGWVAQPCWLRGKHRLALPVAVKCRAFSQGQSFQFSPRLVMNRGHFRVIWVCG